MPISFRPTKSMNLNQIEAAIIIYTFQTTNVQPSFSEEKLISTFLDVGVRKTLLSLHNQRFVDQEVLNLLVCKLTFNQKKFSAIVSAWFLPTYFSQYVLKRGERPELVQKIRRIYQERFMGKACDLRKIFIPINDDNIHWYLLVVDINSKTLNVLDSLPSPSRRLSTRLDVKKLAVYLEEILTDSSFYDSSDDERLLISDYALTVPEGIGRQLNGSNDCGVWVAQWMSECIWTNNYSNVSVTPETRMRLALDLVLGSYNELRDEVVQKASKNWMELVSNRKKLVQV
ncbi:unnamed protein product [Cuscuta epithymum]|uniref:Ubiquitin-like protease family profile domain-containing protein n=1 Tax=Cuscuta epithymum TaxID=186058 RepID=A0AAV0CA47_9ASTE|nr:unnamed protein product [Cuscuta epithymum]